MSCEADIADWNKDRRTRDDAKFNPGDRVTVTGIGEFRKGESGEVISQQDNPRRVVGGGAVQVVFVDGLITFYPPYALTKIKEH